MLYQILWEARLLAKGYAEDTGIIVTRRGRIHSSRRTKSFVYGLGDLAKNSPADKKQDLLWRPGDGTHMLLQSPAIVWVVILIISKCLTGSELDCVA